MKPNINRIINKIKSGVKTDKTVEKIKTQVKPVQKHSVKERNMMQEAIDMGSHNSKEYFGGLSDKSE
jgi:hypothetical protein